ncbi:MAG TPA: DUF3078 domain-containing protein [Bacteroidales bacterium]|nr:DUF3078 domain-containing protein [Bacteroidales bacterium]
MRESIIRSFQIFVFLSICISAQSQGNIKKEASDSTIVDSLKKSVTIFNYDLKKPEITLSKEQSLKFLQEKIKSQYWNNDTDQLRLALGQLVFEASNPPYDSSEYFLKRYPYDSISIPWEKFFIWEPVKKKASAGSTGEPTAEIRRAADTTAVADTNMFSAILDSLFAVADTSAKKVVKDSVIVARDTLHDKIPTVEEPLAAVANESLMPDTTFFVVIDTLNEVKSSRKGFPFKYYNYPFQSDSIQVAVNSLLKYLEDRDSTIINFTGAGNRITPVWLNSKAETMTRYWLRNEFNDSVTVWIGAPSRNTFDLYLEQGINLKRPVKQGVRTEARIDVQEVDKSKLLDVKKITVKPQYWKSRGDASFTLNQTSLTNWVKGGVSSVSSTLDVIGYLDYNNKVSKVVATNFARLRFGVVATDDDGFVKNLDLFETNSKVNHKAFGKFDFSGVMLFKTQMAPGRSDGKMVSKFLNPATLTIGFGLDWKPNKNTSVNFSPLSYKGTFVTDTVRINQTDYGIAADRKSLHEPGVSLQVSNVYKPTKAMTLTNTVQLFTNYINKPQNIDIDWEMTLVAPINWFTEARINTHFIFDDDTKSLVYNKHGEPILNDLGVQKKTARIQFKEILGFSLVFRF